jgi:hypothetical protein
LGSATVVKKGVFMEFDSWWSGSSWRLCLHRMKIVMRPTMTYIFDEMNYVGIVNLKRNEDCAGGRVVGVSS